MDTGQATSGEGERPHSDNETDLVMELFAKFNNPTSRPEQPQQPKSEPLMVEIPVAAASYLSQYEFLPGHFDVRYVISEISEADAGLSYQVRLQSGETEMVRVSLRPLTLIGPSPC